MSLTYDTPAGKLVYDAYPETEYEADGFRPHSTRVAGPAVDYHVVWNQPHREASSAGSPPAHESAGAPSGFGNVFARPMLTVPPPKFPWLTPALAEQELAIAEYQRDRVQCAMDTIEDCA